MAASRTCVLTLVCSDPTATPPAGLRNFTSLSQVLEDASASRIIGGVVGDGMGLGLFTQ